MPRRLLLCCLAAGLCLPGLALAAGATVADPSAKPDVPAITYRENLDANTVLLRSWYDTWNGHRRALSIVFPRQLEGTNAALPLLVAAHPAGGASTCADAMATLPGRFRFVLACLDGQGDYSRSFSYGSPGQVHDLAMAPAVIARRLPGIRVDSKRLYIVGSSMGGTEALLVGLRYPLIYREAVALDPVSDLTVRFASLPLNRRWLLEAECGGPPADQLRCYRERSPLSYVGARPAGAAVLNVWYSTHDPVSGAAVQVPTFVAAERPLMRPGQLRVRIGRWGHGALWDRPEHRAAWLIDLGLVPVGGLAATHAYGSWPDARYTP